MTAQKRVPENINQLWSHHVVNECVRNGITAFCISPGSRSTPLTVAAARHPGTDIRMLYDERGAAFQALGYARATGKAAVLICSSGTAAANYFPAVIEAAQENLPMLILSADRPPELRDSGANQTIDQVKLFGGYTRFFQDMPPPTETISLKWLLSTINYGLSLAHSPYNAGPVHFNFMFREPLAPVPREFSSAYATPGQNDHRPATRYLQPVAVADKAMLEPLTTIKEGFILVGRLENPDARRKLEKLAAHLKWPLIADITSGLRLKKTPGILAHADLMLLRRDFRELLLRHPLVHFGGQFLSKRLLQLLERHPGPCWHISPWQRRVDAALSHSHELRADVGQTAGIWRENSPPGAGALLGKCLQIHDDVERTLNAFCRQDELLDELSIARLVSRATKQALYLASSMPVRDMDMAAVAVDGGTEHVGANRGTSGIDGTIASAIGYSRGLEAPLTLLIGDLAFLHDMNSLAQLRDHKQAVTIVVINNNSGAIFNFLPIAEYKEVFDPFFNTPHNYEFSAAAAQFGLEYHTAHTVTELATVLEGTSSAHRLIEARVRADYNVERHKALYRSIEDRG
ncbi:MAG TPA: 2-succinyl-5-enolpyruvyl-6-hydroxy-3-cyclohexene-1-carboxylic-acid synthase [Caldithrix abyssi]|uniref:2-succinyl-5-enolpyruvyl-6-hydroxy-3-cyclohexene-1-carboxylate synthase n=1 Tax=Caldithrix abyssi TaxID=187145 RepID=A0A7V5RPD1_CALAY|nr:2-succinyl-5-enolpyruvyl-6-hydroxy-3-cyclohexene-1-carboxylic-acid synthase [Caldithrix abyssi]